MKVGILTYHRTYNYGGCLQALATRLIIESLGHKVYYVDYWPKYHRDAYRLLSFSSIFKAPTLASGIRSLVDAIRYYPYRVKRKNNFEAFLTSEIYPYLSSVNDYYDVVVYGSDQIWRKQGGTGDYNPIYFGNNCVNTQKHVAFSASMGILPETKADMDRVKRLLSSFDSISVRETDLKELLLELGYGATVQTLDPTLLVPINVWNKYLSPTKIKKSYILVYALNEAFNMDEVNKFAKEKKLEVITLLGSATHFDTEEEITTAGPFEFLTLIKNAQYVFSSSFHGLAFSLIFNKELFVSFKTNSSRVKSLLALLGISERFVEPSSVIPSNIPMIDYNSVNAKLEELRQDSINFLKSL